MRAQRKHWRKWRLNRKERRKYPKRGMRLPMQMDSSHSCIGCPTVPWKTSLGTHKPQLHRLVTITRSFWLALLSVPQSAVCRTVFCFRSQPGEQEGRVPLPLRLLSLKENFHSSSAEGLLHWILGVGKMLHYLAHTGSFHSDHPFVAHSSLDISSWVVRSVLLLTFT